MVSAPTADASADGELLLHHGDDDARGAVVDFAVNVVPATPPEFMLHALAEELTHVAAYPDEAPTRRTLAEHLGIEPEAVLLVNGAAEAFTLIARLERWRRPVVVHPQFTEPEVALSAAGAVVERKVLAPETGLAMGDDLVEAWGTADHTGARPDLVVIGNPTNPTSRLHRARTIEALADPGRTLVVDEAFIDVVPGQRESLLVSAADASALVVLRSLTKTYGLAGIRAGFVVGHPRVIARLRVLQPPWSVNSLALAAIRATVTPQARTYHEQVVADLRRWRRYQESALGKRGWSVVSDGVAPFVLARHPQGATLRMRLRERGYAIRRGDTFPGLDATWARFAVRSPQTVDALMAQLDDLIDEVAGAGAPCRTEHHRADIVGGTP